MSDMQVNVTSVWMDVTGLDGLPDGATVGVRVTQDAKGRYDVTQLHISMPVGERLKGEHLRKFQLDLIETYANHYLWQASGGK